MRSRPVRLLLAALALGAVAAWPGTGAAAAACAPTTTSEGAPVPGGEWRTYGHDYSNTRSQDLETTIGPNEARQLAPVWTFASQGAGGDGDFTGTPTVADGCVYAGSNGGWVFAMNADTGELVWKTQVPDGGGINSSVTVTGGVVYAAVSHASRTACQGTECEGPYVIALDQATGALLWQSSWTMPGGQTVGVIDGQVGSDVYGTPTIFDGMLLEGVSGGSAELGDPGDREAFQGSVVVLDQATGVVMEKIYTIHAPDAPDDGYAGAGVWSTPAIDPVGKVAYVGAGNPFRPQKEHPHTNSVLKIDLDRASPTFGTVIDSYKGTIDEYIPQFSNLPCFDIPGNPPPYYPQGIGSCGDIDMDFGAAPNLFTVDGIPMVGDGQKSGVYHAFDAATMGEQKNWTQIVGPPTSVGGIVGSTAFDGTNIYGPITVPGMLWSIGKDAGALRWVEPLGDVHWGEPVAHANGVIYTVDFRGFLDAFDAATGLPLLARPLILGSDAQAPGISWGGVSVARNTVYAAIGNSVAGGAGFIVAFRPGGTGGLPGLPNLPPLPSVGAGLTVLAGPGAASTTYLTPLVVVRAGDEHLNFVNLDLAPHNVVHDAPTPLFSSGGVIGLGQSDQVEFFTHLESGKTYDFFCTLHPGMFGKILAV
jgi:polyvinyl alcohol dehydrogenase (cytochrome)